MRQELPFGGLSNSKHESKTPVGKCYSMQNAEVDLGIIKGRYGYSSFATGFTPTAGYGLCHGKYGSNEEYIAVLTVAAATALYRMNISTGALTAVSGSLNASDWFMVQYQDKFFYCNETDGIRYKTVGGASASNTLTGPTTAPTVTKQNSYIGIDFSATGVNATYAISGMSATMATSNKYSIKVTATAGVTDATEVTLTATFGSDASWEWRDFVWLRIIANNSASDGTVIHGDDLRVQTISANASPVTVEPDYYGTGQVSGATPTYIERQAQFANENRAERGATNDVHKMVFTFTLDRITNTKFFYIQPYLGDNWMNDSDALFVDDGPTVDTIEYAYSWWDDSASIETELSPVKASGAVPGNQLGSYINVLGTQATGGAWDTAGGTADKIYFYRKEKATGIWRRVGSAANSSTTPNTDDHYMEHELKDLTEYPGLNLPASFKATAIGVWKQCLVLGENDPTNNHVGVAYISGVGKPFRFLPPPDQASQEPPDDADEDRPRTVFVSDNRAEKLHGIHGQDSLYFVTPFSCYAMVGDTPSGATVPRRLPGSRGSVGQRASCAYRGGILVGAQDGLWYYSVGRGFSGEDNGAMVERELTDDARTSWKTLLGTDSTKWDQLTVTEFEDELLCVCQTRYMRFTRNNEWVEGTFTDAIEVAVPVRSLGLKWLRQAGKIDKVFSDGSGTYYTTDDGTAITWTYDTGILDSPFVLIRSYEMQGDGKAGVRFTIYGDADGAQYYPGAMSYFDRQAAGQVHMLPFVMQPGFRTKMKFKGVSGTDTIEQFAFDVSEVPGGRGN